MCMSNETQNLPNDPAHIEAMHAALHGKMPDSHISVPRPAGQGPRLGSQSCRKRPSQCHRKKVEREIEQWKWPLKTCLPCLGRLKAPIDEVRTPHRMIPLRPPRATSNVPGCDTARARNLIPATCCAGTVAICDVVVRMSANADGLQPRSGSDRPGSRRHPLASGGAGACTQPSTRQHGRPNLLAHILVAN